MKNFSRILILALGILIGNTALAQTQNLGDLIDSLGNEITFGYNTSQKVSITAITSTSVTISSPLLKNQAGTNITKYTLMFSEYPLADILEKTDLLNQTKEKTIELTGTANPFTMELGTADNIDPTKKYYLFVIPKDSNETLGEVSNEVRFQLGNQSYGEGNSSGTVATTATTTQVHNAAGADMTLANITHTINGNIITLKWTAVAGSTNVDIAVMDPNTSIFNRVASVRMQDESYTYTASRNGEFIFQFAPDNGGKQVNYTLTMNGVSGGGTKTTTEIKKVPRTGPTENFVAVMLISIVFYFGYKKLYKKAK